jgi:hypothetical protein
MKVESEAAADDVINFYNDAFNKLSQEIIEGVNEGFKEGIKAGIRKGFLESVDLSFLGLKKEEPRSLESILEEAISEGLQNTASTLTERNACPALQSWLSERCNEAVALLSSKGSIETAKDASDLAGFLKLEEKADKKMEELSNQAKEVLPSNIIVTSLYSGVQATLWSCTNESIRNCQKRIAEMKSSQEISPGGNG